MTAPRVEGEALTEERVREMIAESASPWVQRLAADWLALTAGLAATQARLDAFYTHSADCDDVAWRLAGALGLADQMQNEAAPGAYPWVNYLWQNRDLLESRITALGANAKAVTDG